MGKILYGANFPPETDEETLRALFSEHGEVVSFTMGEDARAQQPYALVEMKSEKQTTRAMNKLNGYTLGGQRLAVSPAEPELSKDITARQRKTAAEIIATLEESEKVPVRQIEAIVRFCGGQFAQAILEEALEIDAGEGVLTSDGSRRRTKGGVFFYLARYRMSPAVRKIVYNRKGKVPGEKYD